MKKKSINLLLLLILFCFSNVKGQSKPLFHKEINDITTTKPERSVLNSDGNSITISYDFFGCTTSKKNVDGQVYQFINIEGFSQSGKPGEPSLPGRTDLIAIPQGATVDVIIKDSEFEEYDNVLVHPALEPKLAGMNAPKPVFKLNDTIYNSDSYFPKKLVNITDVQKIRSKPLAFVQINPVQFNPAKKTIRVYSKIVYKLKFSAGQSNKLCDLYKSRPGYLNRYLNIVVNKDLLQKEHEEALKNPAYTSRKRGFDEPKNYIIITTPEFETAADSLSKWKNQLGYSTEIVTQSTWSTIEVKNAIQSRYLNWNPKPDYFVILGDHDDVPGEMESFDFSHTTYTFPTDLYYACMDGVDDYFPDMAHGRLSVSSSDEAMLVVQKIINYERNPVTDAGFYENVLNRAYFQNDPSNPGYSDMRFTHTSEEVRDYLVIQGYSVERSYYTGSSISPTNYQDGAFSSGEPIPSTLLKPGFAWNGNNQQIIDAVNSGKFLVCNNSHGNFSGWGNPYFSTSNVSQLSNGNKLPVVFSISCQTGGFDRAECFAEKWLRHPNGGAVGIVAASEISFVGTNDAIEIGMFNAIWPSPGLAPQFGYQGVPDPVVTEYTSEPSMGDVLNHGLINMTETWSGFSYFYQFQFELFQYFGDPAMKIWTQAPVAITATHDNNISTGATSISIQSSSCLNGLATLSVQDEIVGSVVLSGGAGSITFDLGQTSATEAILTISKHNFRPYIASLPIEQSNLALNKPVVVSDENLPNDPKENLVDGDEATHWSAEGFPQYAEIDLGEDFDLTSIELLTYQNRDYQYIIEAKVDGGSYEIIIDRSANTEGTNLVDAISATARYIKITVSGAYSYTSTWCSINEFKVFGGTSSGIPVTDITLSESSLDLVTGQLFDLDETISPTDATFKTVTWSSGNESIATVNNEGIVSAIAEGTVQITATTSNGLTASCIVSVSDEPQAEIFIDEDFSGDDSDFTVISGGTWSISGEQYVLSEPVSAGAGLLGNMSVHNTNITGDFVLNTQLYITGTSIEWNDAAIIFNYQDENNFYYVSFNESNDENTKGVLKVVDGTPTELVDITIAVTDDTFYDLEVIKTGSIIDITLDGTQIATVSDGTFSDGKVGYGSKNDGAIFDNLLVTVPEPQFVPVTGINVSPSGFGFTVGNEFTVTASISPSDATNKDVIWTSSTPSIASIDANGKVTGLAPGTCVVRGTSASNSSIYDECTVTVSPILPADITLDRASLSLNEGQTMQLIATVSPTNATDKSVTWSSTDNTVATVDANGQVTGIGAGDATIHAETVNGLTALCSVNVISEQQPEFLIDEDFSDDASDFMVIAGGTWAVNGDKYELTNPTNTGIGLLGNISVHNTVVTGDFELNVQLNITGTSSDWNDAAILISYQDPDNYCYVSLNESNDEYTKGIFAVTDGIPDELADFNDTISGSADYAVKIIKTDNSVVVYLDGTEVASATDAAFVNGKVGFGTKNDGAVFDDLQVMLNYTPVAVVWVDEISTGTEEINREHFQLNVYPNPCTDNNIKVSIFGINNSSDCKVQIVDIMGKVIFHKQFSGESDMIENISIQTQGIQKGIYILSVMNGYNLQQEIIVLK